MKRQLKDVRATLDEKTKQTIEALDDDRARLLLSVKWIDPLVSRIKAIPDGIIDAFVERLRALAAKYSTTYADCHASTTSSPFISVSWKSCANSKPTCLIRCSSGKGPR